MDQELFERELLARAKQAKSMPEGRRRGKAGSNATGWGCWTCLSVRWSGQAPYGVPHPFHIARTGPLIVRVFSRYHDVVHCLAMGRRSMIVTMGRPSAARVCAGYGPCHGAERHHASARGDARQRLLHGATLLPVPGPLLSRRRHRPQVHALGSVPGGLFPRCALCYFPAPPRGCACVGQRSRAKPEASSSSFASTARRRVPKPFDC